MPARVVRAARQVRPYPARGGAWLWTPAREPTTLCWFRADKGVVLSGGNVATWTDTVGGVILTASGVAATMSTFDGQVAVHTAGGRLLSSVYAAIPPPFSFYWVGRADTPGAAYAILITHVATNNPYIAMTNVPGFEIGSSIANARASGNWNTACVIGGVAQSGATASSMYKNNLTTPIASKAIGVTDSTQFVLGQYVTPGLYATTGDHADLWIVAGVPSAALLARYVAYVKARYPSVPAAS